jgi:hypothetical protein
MRVVVEFAAELERLDLRLTRENRVTLADNPLQLIPGLLFLIKDILVVVFGHVVWLVFLRENESVVLRAQFDRLRTIRTLAKAFEDCSSKNRRPTAGFQ